MVAHVRLSYEGARNHAALISDALIRKIALGFLGGLEGLEDIHPKLNMEHGAFGNYV